MANDFDKPNSQTDTAYQMDEIGNMVASRHEYTA